MKKTVYTFTVLLCLCLAVSVAVNAYAAPLSPGLEVIKASSKLIKCSVGGEKVSFSPQEISDLVGADFEYLTLSKLPPLSDGVLKVAGVDAVQGQHLSSAGLSLLSFLPASDFCGSCSFEFTVSAIGRETDKIECLIRYSESPRFSPVAVSAQIKTYKNVSVTSSLGAYDPDGDPLSYSIDKYPSGGIVSVKDGVATYTPTNGFCGTDSFSYYVTDDWGNKSETAVATVTVEENTGGIYFADMQDDPNHLAAIRMSETDVMTYRLIGDSYYFSPLENVSRIDYAVMLVSALGIEVPDKLYPTDVFTDTASQSYGKRLYLESAVVNGLVDADSECFRPNDVITVEEAVAMTERAQKELSISTAWFESESAVLTKKDAAILLCSVYSASD